MNFFVVWKNFEKIQLNMKISEFRKLYPNIIPEKISFNEQIIIEDNLYGFDGEWSYNFKDDNLIDAHFICNHLNIQSQNDMNKHLTLDDSAIYRIQIQGVLSAHWAEFLGGLEISIDEDLHPPVTTLSGQVVDQAALVGIINSVYDLGYPLLTVKYESLSRDPRR